MRGPGRVPPGPRARTASRSSAVNPPPGGGVMFDLVLKGGRVVDPSTNLDGLHDIAVQDGKVARIAADIPAGEATHFIEVGGKLVTPGLIDLHAHVFEGVNRTGVNPDLGGVLSGVTTIVDAGSAGAATFAAFPRHILPHCHTEVIPFLHICQTGLATLPDIVSESSVNLDDTLKTLDQYKGLIHGIWHAWCRPPSRSWAWRCRGSPSARPRRAARGSWCTSATRRSATTRRGSTPPGA